LSPDSATHDCIAVPAVEAFERIEEVAGADASTLSTGPLDDAVTVQRNSLVPVNRPRSGR
jgi:hypothetical protein